MILRGLKALLRIDPPRSSFQALSALLPRGDFEKLLVSVSDKREIFCRAAALLKLDEISLMRRLASRLDLPFVEKPRRVSMGPEVGCTSGDLRRVGAVFGAAENGSIGIVCIDPASCEKLPGSVKRLPCFIGAWPEIARAHEEEKPPASIHSNPSTLAQQVLQVLISECKSCGADGVDLYLNEEKPEYRFRTRQGKTGFGTLNPGVVASLRDYLDAVASGACSCALPQSAEMASAPPGIYRMSWLDSGKAHGAESRIRPMRTAFQPEGSRTNQEIPFLGTVLIIDDNDTFATVLERYLGRIGVSVLHRTDGAAAVSEIAAIAPDLVICDVHMPLLGGGEVLKRLRSAPETEFLPAIMLTSDSDTETEVRLLNDGADAYVTKGEDPRILCAHVQRLLSRNSRLKRAA